MTGPAPIARQVLTEWDVAALAARIADPERTRVVVVVTSGHRAPSDRLDAARIAAEVGPDVDVVTMPTGSLTYALERGLPDGTAVFGDAARTYPAGAAWHTRPYLSPLRHCRADADATRVLARVVADARAAARRATEPPPPSAGGGLASPPARQAAAGWTGPTVTPATLPGAPVKQQPVISTGATVTPAELPGGPARPAGDEAAATPAPSPVPSGPIPPIPTPAMLRPAMRTPTGPPAAPTPTVHPPPPTKGPTPATPQGTPTRSAHPAAPRAASRRFTEGSLWHATSAEDGRALAQHLMAVRGQPVLVITTPSERSGPLVDAEDLHQRVREIAGVVVLHNGPASWALAHAMPPMTEVYGGAGRVYSTDLGWLSNPYRAPIRFCWPGDDPATVADQLEDDAYAAANLAGLTASHSAAATVADRGRVKGLLGRHHVLLELDRGGSGALLVDQLFPGIEPDRLLQRGQILTGRVQQGHVLSPFQPDAIEDDPVARAVAAYAAGDVVLARVTQVGSRSGRALLHPKVEVSIQADEESDLRNLVAVADVVALTLTATGSEEGHFVAELADADAASVACISVLPGGPPWLVDADLPTEEPEPAPEPEPQPGLEHGPAAEPVAEAPPVAPASAAGTAPAPPAVTPATVGEAAQIAGLNAQIHSLTALLDEQRRKARSLEEDASRARQEAQKLRRKVRSLEDQHQAYRERVEGEGLFGDPEVQLRYEIEQTWLRRTPEPERAKHRMANYTLGPQFLESLARLEGIGRDKVLDVLVEVLTDRAKDIPGRELHPLRESESSPVQRVRATDGARAWRCALQVGTHSARRLHFWRMPGNRIEFDSVGVHDARM